ncbi:unnamed protein product [Pleuronectes platessa]|uniref:Uncharacterized protein n=1 Tax=Pleuronectes platessa TaxID=8262 RepID=A0A9N7YL83_PLEPL|nr:unnamed protein product [Pleuronectes platessa]
MSNASAHHLKINLDKTAQLYLPGKSYRIHDLTITIDNSIVAPTRPQKAAQALVMALIAHRSRGSAPRPAAQRHKTRAPSQLHRDLRDPELQAHEYKETPGQWREPLMITGGWFGGLKASKPNTEAP